MYKVLVVEDEAMIRKGLIFSTNFESLHCIVVGEAQNGEEGIQMIRSLRPDIVITDINMPLVNGIEMMEQTSDISYSSIVISGYDEFSYAKKALKFGVTDYLLKPISQDELYESIHGAIEQLEMREQYRLHLQNKHDICNFRLLDVEQKDQRKDRVVDKMLEYVEQNYKTKILMSDICEQLNYSETLLNRRFKNITTYTFNDYLNRYRIQKTIDLIKKKELYIYDIAEQSGFHDYKYFNLVFKKYIGCSPKDFMQALD